MWHFCNNDVLYDKTDKLFKIREVLTYAQNKFQSVTKQELSLDEGITSLRGRLSFRNYNLAKLEKYGILVRMLCEATSGYIWKFQVYSSTAGRL